MRYGNWEQRLMDQESGRHLDSLARDREARAIRAGCAEVGNVNACVYPNCCDRNFTCRPAEIVRAALAAIG